MIFRIGIDFYDRYSQIGKLCCQKVLNRKRQLVRIGCNDACSEWCENRAEHKNEAEYEDLFHCVYFQKQVDVMRFTQMLYRKYNANGEREVTTMVSIKFLSPPLIYVMESAAEIERLSGVEVENFPSEDKLEFCLYHL